MNGSDEIKFRAFLSYSHTDAAWARRIHVGLENFQLDSDLVGRRTRYGVIPRSLVPIFRDREEFSAGQSLSQATLAALDASASVVVLCSLAAAKSFYVNQEIATFLSRHPSRPIIPVIVACPDEIGPIECFPQAMRDLQSGVGRDFILAADLRSGRDEFRQALAKIVAGILDLNVDDIRKRSEIVWRRRVFLRSIASSMGGVLTVVAGYLAWEKYTAVVNERNQSRDLREAFDELKQRDIAMQLVNSGRFREGLEIVVALHEKAVARSKTNPNDERMLKRLMDSHYSLGFVYEGGYKFGMAVSEYDQSRKLLTGRIKTSGSSGSKEDELHLQKLDRKIRNLTALAEANNQDIPKK